ncbi:hypothetical protein K438DRAFT_1962916 [Mycena galopus ATCC 62051]|nr:hypothetical protein K438DRAFT_1962916 [Mycena galopus ATCC 62051]
MAGVRLAVLKALRRIEDMVWHYYGIMEYAFPNKLIRHPFLFPLEAAKLQVLWHILQRNGRDILADAIHEVLSILLHKDYAVSICFNAVFLDAAGPITLTITIRSEDTVPADARYWFLSSPTYAQRLTAVQATCVVVTLASSPVEVDVVDEFESLTSARHLTCTTAMYNQSPVDAIHDAMTEILANSAHVTTKTDSEPFCGLYTLDKEELDSVDFTIDQDQLERDWAELEEDDKFIFYPVQLFGKHGDKYQSFTLYQRTKGDAIVEIPGHLEWEQEDEASVPR